MMFWIDLENGAGAKVGSGPITTAPSVDLTERLDRAGRFRFSVPAGDPKAASVAEKLRARVYAILGGALVEIGGGVVDKITTRLDANATPWIDVDGDDLLRELTYRQVKKLTVDDGSGGTTTDCLDPIMALAPAGWALDPAGYAVTQKAIKHDFDRETVLNAFVRLAEITGEHFRLGAGRYLRWLQDDQTDSGYRAVVGGDDDAIAGADKICRIVSISEESSSYDLATRVYPAGIGNGTSELTLSGSAWSPPAGYAIDTANNYIRNTAAETTYGIIEKTEQFKDVGDADTLAEQAYEWLRRHDAPYKSYRLRLAGVKGLLYVGDTIRVVCHVWVDDENGTPRHAIDIDDDLVILEATTKISEDGANTVEIMAATADRWPDDDTEALVNTLNQATTYIIHTQPVAASEISGDLDINTLRVGGGTNYATIGSGGVVTLFGSAYVQLPAAQPVYFGDAATNDSWRIVRSGNDLVFERRESGSWVTKGTITP